MIARRLGDGVSVVRLGRTCRRMAWLLSNEALWEELCVAHFGWGGVEREGMVGRKRYADMYVGYDVHAERGLKVVGQYDLLLDDGTLLAKPQWRRVQGPSGHWQECTYEMYHHVEDRHLCSFDGGRGILCCTPLGDNLWLLSTSRGVACLTADGKVTWPAVYEKPMWHNTTRMFKIAGQEQVLVVSWHSYSDSGARVSRVSRDAMLWSLDLPCAGVGHSEYEHRVDCGVHRDLVVLESVGSYARWTCSVRATDGAIISRYPEPQ